MLFQKGKDKPNVDGFVPARQPLFKVTIDADKATFELTSPVAQTVAEQLKIITKAISEVREGALEVRVFNPPGGWHASTISALEKIKVKQDMALLWGDHPTTKHQQMTRFYW